MAFGKKEKKNPSSRYSRIEDPWLDEDDTASSASQDDLPLEGYGVEDSYSRQASYGRPEGYYTRRGTDSGYDSGRGTKNIDNSRYGYRNGGAYEGRGTEDGYGSGSGGCGRDAYGRDDYARDGYDENDGYDRDGYDENDGYGRDAYDGYENDGYGRDGYESDGYGRDGYGSDGYGDGGYGRDSYGNDGYGRDSCGQDGYGNDGYGRDSYGPDGYGNDGYGRDGYGPDGYGRDEYGRDGYASDGYDRQSAGRSGGYRKGESGSWGDDYDSRGKKKSKNRKQRGAGSGRNDAGEYMDGAGAQGGAAAAARGRFGKGFVLKLILLIIATLALLLVWRFSRMKHLDLKDILTNTGVTAPEGFQDFVIYGVDSREGNLLEEAHSDTIMICSMNRTAKEIRLVSVYRDTYLDNTNGEYRKATECYYFGGPSRSVNMLNKNLDLNLKDYITVDFNAVVEIVDLVGGVDVDVTEEELPYINGYQTENAQVTGAQITPVESAGYQHLNGIQALAYCRIRYTAGSDYRRTERQRAVLSQVLEQARKQGPVKIAQIVDAVLPKIATSFSSAELLSLATSVADYTIIDTTGFPFELQAANISAGDCVVPVNLAQNVTQLHAFLYQKSGYVPSETVQQISNEIGNATGIW